MLSMQHFDSFHRFPDGPANRGRPDEAGLTRSRRLDWVLILGALLLGLAGLWHATRFDFVCDDAYISFRYAQNLSRHGVLVWNLGERVEGYTNFLWTVLLAGVDHVGIAIPKASLIFGRLFGVAGLFVLLWISIILRREVGSFRSGPGSPAPTDRNGRSTSQERQRSATIRSEWQRATREPLTWLAPLLAASTAGYACWSSGGLETQMFTFLATAAMGIYLYEAQKDHHTILSSLVMALAAMTRPEGVLLYAIMVLHRLTWDIPAALSTLKRHRISWSSLGRRVLWGAGFVMPYGLYFLWRYHYYGYLFPNTYYVKASSPNWAQTRTFGWTYLSTFARDYHLVHLTWIPAVGLAWSLVEAIRKRPFRSFAWSLWILLATGLAAHVIRVGGDFMAMHRFWVPLIPVLALMMQEGLRPFESLVHVHASISSQRFPLVRALWATALIALLGASAVNSYHLGHRSLTTLHVHRTGYDGEYDHLESVAFMKKFADDRVLIGRFLQHRVPADAWIAVGGAGAIVYASGLRAIDSFGLSDLHIAHDVKATNVRPGHEKRASLGYILSRHPDIICTPGIVRLQDWEYRPNRAERARWERLGYEYFCADPPHLKPSHYCCLMRVDRDLGLKPVSAYRY